MITCAFLIRISTTCRTLNMECTCLATTQSPSYMIPTFCPVQQSAGTYRSLSSLHVLQAAIWHNSNYRVHFWPPAHLWRNAGKGSINIGGTSDLWLPSAHAPRGTVVILCVCVSVTTLAATYLVCKSKLRCYTVSYGVPNVCIVWNPLKTFSFGVICWW